MSSHPTFQRRLRPKVILYPRKKNIDVTNKKTPEMCLESLRVPPADRTEQDVDNIVDVVGKWPDFRSNIRTDQERREVCRSIMCEEKEGNTLLFKQGDQPDGWWLIFRGQCSIHIKMKDDSKNGLMPPATLALLRKEFNDPDANFFMVAVRGYAAEFGSVALTKNAVRNATIVVDTPSILLRVDPQLYRDTAAWFNRAQIEKKANLLAHIPELSFLRESRELFTRLAENMPEHHYETGELKYEYVAKVPKPNNPSQFEEKLATITSSFLIVEDGLLGMQRVVDFSKHQQDTSKSSIGVIPIRIPKGKFSVRLKTLGPKTMFPVPGLTDFVAYPFSMIVLEPVTVYELKLSDMASLLPRTQLERIKEAFRKEPPDEAVATMWIEKQQAIQWQAFKRKCV